MFTIGTAKLLISSTDAPTGAYVYEPCISGLLDHLDLITCNILGNLVVG